MTARPVTGAEFDAVVGLELWTSARTRVVAALQENAAECARCARRYTEDAGAFSWIPQSTLAGWAANAQREARDLYHEARALLGVQ